MFRKAIILAIICTVIASAAFAGIIPHRHKKNNNPLAGVNSKQPDKVLFDRAMEAMKHGKYDVARLTLQTLINTYPDSEYIARAKLSIGDAWYNEGGTTALAQAEIEYKDFITFFPNMPEAAEAQLKVANIHYRQMGKPDRDYTHARRAEDEYRQLIEQFPDSKLVPQAQQRLREVQEVLAEREFRIARFYDMKESYPAAIARLETLTTAYPLYSNADEALYMLGDAYEHEADLIRRAPTTGRGHITELAKGKLIQLYTNKAAEAYAKIVTRYPVMDRASDAKRRLEALHRRVPTPTAAEIAQNKAEQASRSETGAFGRLMLNFKHGPDVAQAAKVGEPTMDDPREASAVDMIRSADETVRSGGATGPNAVSATVVGTGPAPASEPVPRSDADGASSPDSGNSTPAATDSSSGNASDTSTPNSSAVSSTSDTSGNGAGIGELAPTSNAAASSSSPAAAGTATARAANSGSSAPPQNQAANGETVINGTDASGAGTNVKTTAPAVAPTQVNEADPNAGQPQSEAQSQTSTNSDNSGSSTSKKKKKKGLHKLIPF